jgi:hypothetical protein
MWIGLTLALIVISSILLRRWYHASHRYAAETK